MKDLLSKFKPILIEDGILYPPPSIKDKADCTIILEDLDIDSSFKENWNYNKGRVLGFGSYHKLTVEPHRYVAISKKMGNPGKHIILETDHLLEIIKPIDYADTIGLALNKAHDYMLHELLEEVLHPNDVYVNLLDQTKIGREKFNKMNKNEAKISKNKPLGIIVDKSNATREINMNITPFPKNSSLNH